MLFFVSKRSECHIFGQIIFMKKLYFLIFALLSSTFVFSQDLTVPDIKFNAKLLQATSTNAIAKNLLGIAFKIDANNDGIIQVSEAEQVSELNVAFSQIEDLTGIEYFTALKVLKCEGNKLTSLDVSSSLLLESLNCSSNKFVSLEVTDLPSLNNLVVAPNSSLVNLTVTNLPQLTLLKLHANLFSSQLDKLVTLNCSNNGLTSLILYVNYPGLDLLKNIDCSNNALTTLNIKDLVLHTFNASNNQLTTLETTSSSLSAVTFLDISNNDLTSFEISSEVLTDFQFNDNPLESMTIGDYAANQTLDFSSITTLESLKLSGFTLNELVIGSLPVFTKLNLNVDVIQPVLLENLPMLKNIVVFAPNTEIICSNLNAFTAIIPIYEFTAAEKFEVTCKKMTFKNSAAILTAYTNFHVEELVLENLPNLTDLNVEINDVYQSGLVLENLPSMTNLKIGTNQSYYISESCFNLELQNFPSLTTLEIGRVKINNFTIGNVPNLTTFQYLGGSCYETENSLVLDALPALTTLEVMDPLLDHLTISNLPVLYDITIESQELNSLVLTNLPLLHDLDLTANWNYELNNALPVLNISNLPNLYDVVFAGITQSLVLQNLPSLHNFKFDYEYGPSTYDLYPMDYVFNDLPALYHLELNNIQTNNLAMSNLPSLNTLKMFQSEIGNTYTFQNSTLETIDLDNVKNLQNITFSNLSNIKNIQLINFYSYLQSLNFNAIPTLEKFTLLGNSVSGGMSNLSFANYENLQEITVRYALSNLTLTNLPNLTYLNTSGNKFSNLNLISLPNLTEFISNSNSLYPTYTINLKDLPLLSKVDVSYNNDYLKKLDFSECPSLSELHFIKYNSISPSNSPIKYLNLRNGNGNIALMETSPVESMCVDDQAEKELLQTLNPDLDSTIFTSYCSFDPAGTFYTVQGSTTLDTDLNGCDVNDVKMSNVKFSLTSGLISNTFISDETGLYSIPLQEGAHTLQPVFENPSYFSVAPAVSVNFPETTSPFTQNFCITPNGIHSDLEVVIFGTTPARPGFNSTYKILIRNKGNIQQSGSVNFTYNDAVIDFVNASPVPANQASGTLSWNFVDLKPFESREISLKLKINSPMQSPAVNGGDVLNFTATITGSLTDEIIADNSFSLPQIVVNSFDPNDKTCLEGNTITPDMIGEYVHYLIRFENTGTFPAENIVVKDMIDATKFDIATLIPLSASHDYITRINGNQVEFIFEDINLPFYNATNDGYIVFKIKTLPTLALGDSFSNSASIYFDYNFPIVTDPAVTTFATLKADDFVFNAYFEIYPNPTTHFLNITNIDNIDLNALEVYNMLGQLTMKIVNPKQNSRIDVSNLTAGNYILKLYSERGISTAKFIKN